MTSGREMESALFLQPRSPHGAVLAVKCMLELQYTVDVIQLKPMHLWLTVRHHGQWNVQTVGAWNEWWIVCCIDVWRRVISSARQTAQVRWFQERINSSNGFLSNVHINTYIIYNVPRLLHCTQALTIRHVSSMRICDSCIFHTLPHFSHISAKSTCRTFFRINWHFRIILASYLYAKNYQNWRKFDKVLTKTNLHTVFLETWCICNSAVSLAGSARSCMPMLAIHIFAVGDNL